MLRNGKSNLIGTQGDLGVHPCPPVTDIYYGAVSLTSPELSFLILKERAGLMSKGQTPVSWPQGPVVESMVTPGLELSMGCLMLPMSLSHPLGWFSTLAMKYSHGL